MIFIINISFIHFSSFRYIILKSISESIFYKWCPNAYTTNKNLLYKLSDTSVKKCRQRLYSSLQSGDTVNYLFIYT